LVIYGLESYGFCKEGAALDFIQDGRMELDGDLPLNAPYQRRAKRVRGMRLFARRFTGKRA
jgi:hypothetical protein